MRSVCVPVFLVSFLGPRVVEDGAVEELLGAAGVCYHCDCVVEEGAEAGPGVVPKVGGVGVFFHGVEGGEPSIDGFADFDCWDVFLGDFGEEGTLYLLLVSR